MSNYAAARLVQLSRWIDEDESNSGRDREALTWHRVAKVAEEAGEVIEAMIGWTGGNPRKGTSSGPGDVERELLDVAVAALCAVEHLRGHDGHALVQLHNKIAAVHQRAFGGVAPVPLADDGLREALQTCVRALAFSYGGTTPDQYTEPEDKAGCAAMHVGSRALDGFGRDG